MEAPGAFPGATQSPSSSSAVTNPETLLAHAGFVRAIARSLVSDENRVDDIVQETWLAALRHPPRHRRSIRAWLGTIALNVARSTLRSESRRGRREHRAAKPESLPATIDIADSKAMIRLVVEAVHALDEPYASMVVMRYYEDLTPGEIAKREGIPVETVRTRLKRANHRMRKHLDGKFDGDRRAWCLALVPLLRGPVPAGTEGGAAIGTLGGSLLPWIAGVGVLVMLATALILWTGSDRGSTDAPLETASQEVPPPFETADATVALTDPAEPEPPVPPLEEPGSLEVTVRWEVDGTPAEGIQARVTGPGVVEALWMTLDQVTDRDGTFVVEGLEPGMAVVHFDRLFGFGHAEILSGERSRLEVAIPPGTDLRGTVRDARDEPIAGAEVFLSRQPFDSGAVVAVTDRHGEYSIRAVSVVGYVGARADGFVGSPIRPLPSKAIQDVRMDFDLNPAIGSVRGVVTDPAGLPVEGAVVSVEALEEAPDRLPDGTRVLAAPATRTRTDATGSYELTCLGEGLSRVSAEADGFQRFVGTVEPREGEAVVLEIGLTAGTTLAGTVRDRATGKPVAFARLRAKVRGDGPGRALHADADAQGRYRFDHLVSGTIDVVADGLDNRGADSTTLEVLDEPFLTWDPELDTGRVIRGRVVDEEGNPLANHEVYAGIPEFDVERYAVDPTMHDFTWLNKDRRGGYFEINQMSERMLRRFRKSARTDAAGYFAIANCDDRAYPLDVYEPEQWSNQPIAWHPGVRPDSGDVTLTVVADALPTAGVSGTIVGPADRPLDGVVVRLRSLDRFYWRMRVTSGSDGRFVFEDVPPSRYELLVDTEDLGLGCRFVRVVELGRDENQDIGVVRLDEPGMLEARLYRTDEGSIGVPRAFLFDETRSHYIPVVFENDTVRSGELAPGRYVLCLHGQGNSQIAWMEYPLEIRSGRLTREEVEVRGGTLRTVHLLASPGFSTIEGKAHLIVRDPSGDVVAMRRFRRAKHARLEFDLVLGAGPHRLEFGTEGGLAASLEVDFSEAGATDAPLEVRLSDPNDPR